MLKVRSNSKLIAEQVAGIFETKELRMRIYFDKASALSCQFQSFSIKQVSRELNQRADELAKGATPGEYDRRTKIVSFIEQNMQSAKQVCNINNEPLSWMDPIIMYLLHGDLPENKNEARNFQIRAARYALIDNHLYRKSFTGPYLRYLNSEDARRLLEEIHEGVCGNHSGGRRFAHKALTAGYYWPYIMIEAREYVKKCDKCESFAPLKHQPAEHVNSIVSPWPFAKWSLDIIRELPCSLGGKHYVLMATFYFTKWVTTEAYMIVNQSDIINFAWKYLICQFGVPIELVADNRTQCQNNKLKELCDTYHMKLNFAFVSYLQSNGQAEATNKAILSIIKKNLEQSKEKWAEALPKVLWAYRTTKCSSIKETLFAMVYDN